MKKPDTNKAVEKARQPVTVPQKDTYTIEEIDKLIKENKWQSCSKICKI